MTASTFSIVALAREAELADKIFDFSRRESLMSFNCGAHNISTEEGLEEWSGEGSGGGLHAP
jgi:hypothetical protein